MSAPSSQTSEPTDPFGGKLRLVDITLGIVIGLGSLAAALCASSPGKAPIVLVWAWGALAVGAFMGLLFGIPRILKATETEDKNNPAEPQGFKAETNNNLIEVSDWLTKIIVGVGLVELTSLPHHLKRIASPLAECLGDKCGLATSVGVIVFFVFIGFLTGYINARTLICSIFIDAAKGMSAREQRRFKALEAVVEDVAKKGDMPLPGTTLSKTPTAAEPPAAAPSPAAPAAAPAEAEPATPADSLPDPDDPNKGRFGGSARVNSRVLEATIEPRSGPRGQECWVELVVRSTDPKKQPLVGNVDFHLHPTFGRTEQTVLAKNNEARITLLSWGVFTVGAVTDGGATRLELDLAKVPGGTTLFYES